MNVFAPAAVWGFWILIGVGWLLDRIGLKGVVTFVLLWFAGFAGSRFLSQEVFFLPYVAVLDIALSLVVFEGDVRLR